MNSTEASNPGQDARFRQGLIRTFDPITLRNTVDIGGTIFADLPLLGVAESASLVNNSVVGVLTVRGDRGMVTNFILGRIVTPNTPAAKDAISYLANSSHVASVATQESTATATFGDLATVGPVVPDVLIGTSGKAQVTLSAKIILTTVTSAPGKAYMGFTISGATGAGADSNAAVGIEGAQATTLNGTRTILLEGLTPGLQTFRAAYSMTGGTANFAARTLGVLAL